MSILRQPGYILRCYSRYSIIKMTASIKIFTRRGGHWPSACENLQRCETERECKSDNFQCHRSGWCKNDTLQSKRELHFGCRRRTSDARPYNDGVFLNNSPVGAAIGRPPTDRWEITTISDITGRAGAKTICAVLNANWPCAEHRTSDARPYNEGVFFSTLP